LLIRLTVDKTEKTVSRLLKLNPFPVTLRKGTRIASVQRTDNILSCTPYKQADNVDQTGEINYIGEVQNLAPEELEKFCSEYGFKILPNLTSGQRNELLLLLFQYNNVLLDLWKKLSSIRALN